MKLENHHFAAIIKFYLGKNQWLIFFKWEEYGKDIYICQNVLLWISYYLKRKLSIFRIDESQKNCQVIKVNIASNRINQH